MTAGRILVVGAGGHAKVVVATCRAAGWMVDALYDDDADKIGARILGVRVAGKIAEARGAPAVCAIGDNAARKRVVEAHVLDWRAVVHPAALVDPTVKLGAGAVVFAGAVVQPDTIVGAHAIVNTAASVDHDGRIGAYAHVAPGAHLAGDVTLDEGVLVGIGASITPGRRVGAWSKIGAGAAVVRDVPPNVVAKGVPARW